ncbi:MAG: TM2 domain-containing protein [Gemmatimonadetes bacterium]|jgi:TM2 domain-containing membrane protein YozV|nr:TM2 domain-containing protein [Gemmatimonadota bacterium]MBT5058354.1 TM2 domain-containing protein [Gemmatimonadota bacterium]MBT5141495.1 TM2 domain-containing protein [Gemmatimonadota bacterium]MBT5590728.1 TM2 domain-containing protein [Gemmatimonadota bacterium]MBT5965137.1 TM2 domain-containing protein [Gemmatimonadota bacterium]
MQADVSPKSRLAAGLLCFFFGWLGVHRFYVGKIGTAILMVLTFGGFGIWATIDLIFIIVGSFRDVEGRPLRRWEEPDVAPARVGELQGRIDRIDGQLTDLQGVLLDMSDRVDQRVQYVQY